MPRWAGRNYPRPLFPSDKISEAGDQVYLSIPKQQIGRGTYLAKEIEYLTKPISEGGLGYKWLNQWSLAPGN